MATRVTPIRLATCVALAAMWTLAGSVSACDGHSKSASAAPSCCATKATTACATPAAKPAATPAARSAAYVPLPSASTPVATTAFPSLPVFTQPAPIVAGLWAFIDPETGMLSGPIGDFTVPDDVTRAFAAPVELTPVALPNGGVMIDLKGTLEDFYVLTIDPLGRRSIRCVQNARHATAPVAPIVLPIAER